MDIIEPRLTQKALVRIPGSKSITHRAVIAASLARGTSVINDYLDCEDTRYTIDALRQLGVSVARAGGRLMVEGQGPWIGKGGIGKRIFLGNSGTSFRLLLSVAALCKGEFLLTGTKRMQQRPVAPLVTALSGLGVNAACVNQNGCPPVCLRASGIRGGRVSLSGEKSSQFISSLLMAGPYSEGGIEIEVAGDLVSAPYVDMTIRVMNEFGVHVDRDHFRRFRIPSGPGYQAREFSVEGDASSASYFWAAAAVTGGMVVTANVHPHTTPQGDIRLLEILSRMGCKIEKGSDGITVHGRGLSAIKVDMSDLPDMVPTLAAVALFARGRTVIRNVAHLRHKESDRLHAVALEWERMGGRVEELIDGLIIEGGRPLSGIVADPHDDHRLAMSLAVIGLRVPHLNIKDRNCVNKSFPGFWNLWEGIKGAMGNGL
jgi:3-phosphoshikimate 1-carboxyvinyltransferase